MTRKLRKALGPTPTPFNTSYTSSSNASLDQLNSSSTKADIDASNGDNAKKLETYNAFATLLAQSDKYSKQVQSNAQSMLNSISDAIKESNKAKASHCRKYIETFLKYHQGFAAIYDDLEKAKINYEKAAKEYDAAEKKYDEAVKKPASGLRAFKNLVTGKDAEQRVMKLEQRVKSKKRALNDARNDYILCLQGANELQNRYYKSDLNNFMAKIDGNHYDNLKALLASYVSTQQQLKDVLEENTQALSTDIAKVSRDKDVSAFLEDNMFVFGDPGIFNFDTVFNDTVKQLVIDESTKEPLGRRLGELVAQDTDITSKISTNEKELAGLHQLASAYNSTPEFGNPNASIEKIIDTQNILSLLKAKISRLSVQIKLLTDGGITPIIVSDVVASPTEPKGNATSPTAVAAIYVVEAIESYEATEDSEISFKAGDMIECINGVYEDEEWWEGRVVGTQVIGSFPVKSTKNWKQVALAFRNRPKVAKQTSNELLLRDMKKSTLSLNSNNVLNADGEKLTTPAHASGIFSQSDNISGTKG